MLRRTFIKTAVLTGAGLALTSPILTAGDEISEKKIAKRRKIEYNLRGDRRSGCASPPDILKNIEGGLNCIPF